MLRIYDRLVIGFNGPLLWRCHAAQVVALYDSCVSDQHLDIGVGSGYFLDHCRFPGPSPALCLLDLNPNSLAYASRRLARYQPRVVLGDVLRPLPFPPAAFRSVGMGFLLHCLPGNMADKARAFKNVAACLAPGGVIFGTTVVNEPDRLNWLARRVMAHFNRRGIFSNFDDRPDALAQQLAEHFTEVEVRLEGAVAMFTARRRPT